MIFILTKLWRRTDYFFQKIFFAINPYHMFYVCLYALACTKVIHHNFAVVFVHTTFFCRMWVRNSYTVVCMYIYLYMCVCSWWKGFMFLYVPMQFCQQSLTKYKISEGNSIHIKRYNFMIKSFVLKAQFLVEL